MLVLAGFPSRGAHRLAGTAALALALPVLAWTGRALAVQSIGLSPAEVTTGGTSTGTVTLDATPTKSVTVQLTSSDPSLVTVPPSISFNATLARSRSRSFTAQTVSGATGCAEISAQLSSTPSRKATITVHPQATTGSGLSLTLNGNPTVGGRTTSGTVTLAGGATGTHTVQLASNNPIASVPATVIVTVNLTEAGPIGSANFPITTSVTDRTRCPVITATLGGNSGRRLLKVVTISG